ncbi:MAG: hypothetical protein QNJ47_05480 [Nostocaceae cyanobacterium]|nr:hypothetical protein [Nostocaceae cyanobacterium]
MSEYQYYEFLTLDRPLTNSEKTYIQSFSSRVELTSSQAIFVYNYGDFRGDPKELLEKCFDAMLYMASWGSRQLIFRFPKFLVDADIFELYCLEDRITVSTTRDFIILDININDEELCHWIDSGEGYLSGLVCLRDDLLRGDYRSLYLAWLKAAPIYFDEEEEDYTEPPVPPNLDDLSESLEVFADFFELEQDLIAAAATASEYQEEESESLEYLIPSLSESEKNDFLLRILKGDSHIGVQLIMRLRELSENHKIIVNSDTPRRTLSELLKLAEGETIKRQEREQEVARQAKVQKLEALAKREDQVWQQVFELITLKQSKAYDQAVAYLVELRDLAEYQGKLQEFQSRIKQMKKDYSKRPGLISRLQRTGLLEF